MAYQVFSKKNLCMQIAVILSMAFSTGTLAQSTDAELQAATQNPVANLISLPFQNNTGFGIGPNNEAVNVLNVQPVIPFALTDDFNLITRTIMPLIYVPGSVEGLDVLPQGVGSGTKFGLGDINITAFLSPAKTDKVIWAIGPSLTIPTATDSLLGSKKWSVGPSAVLLVQPEGWTIGILARQLWSFAGDDDRGNVNQGLVQPFVNYNLDDGWYLVSAPIVTVNWNSDTGDRWTVPVGGGAGKLFRIGSQPINTSLQGYYNVEKPDLAPDWTLRFQVQLLFPK
ncbi:MAG: transporter [Parvibaculaceae bacterium]|nr:transporter [Parvibaculaceae bacterium]